MVHIEIVDQNGQSFQMEIPHDVGLNLMEAALACELPITSLCGGMGICGACHSYVLSDHPLPGISDQETETLDKLPTAKSNSRLICQIRVAENIDGLQIQLAPAS